MKNFKHKTLLVFAVVVGGVILSVGNGCSKSFTTTSTDGSGTNTAAGTGTTGGGSSDVPIIPGTKTVSLVYARQVVDQLAACSGLSAPSGATMQMYEAKKGAISTYGSANTVTAPMMMAVASIAGEICNDLIAQEVSSGERLFVGYNMSSNAVPSSQVIQDSVTRLSLSCWNRMPTQNESDLVMGMIGSSFAGTENTAARKTALMVCTSMLSSLDALLN